MVLWHKVWLLGTSQAEESKFHKTHTASHIESRWPREQSHKETLGHTLLSKSSTSCCAKIRKLKLESLLAAPK